MNNFKIGNEVRLKTGGPRMVIEDILPNNLIVCTYVHNLLENKRNVFNAKDLETAGRIKYCPKTLLE